MPRKLLPVAWQFAQPEVIPACPVVPITYVVHVGIAVWHVVQFSDDGMWFAGSTVGTLNSPTEKFVVEWHAAQSAPCAAVGCTASCAAVGRSTIVTPYQLMPVSWQDWQFLVMPA